MQTVMERALFNAAAERRPARIVRCRGVADVAGAVRLAARAGRRLTVLGGGHGVRGGALADDALAVDTSAMDGIWVDAERRLARVQAGARWAALDRETQLHGLAVTGARISTVGVAGFTLGGGSGWFERHLGLACDSVVAAEVVTADGEVLVASEGSHSELFWALRGGGGNFGVVTALTFRVHPVGPFVLGGMLLYPHERAAEVLALHRELMAGAPDAVGGGCALMVAPPAPFVPEALRGRPALAVLACHAGDLEDAERDLRPLRSLTAPAADLVGVMPYIGLQQLMDAAAGPGEHNHWAGPFLRELDDRAIEALVDHTAAMPSANDHVIVDPIGGALVRATEGPLAEAFRGATCKVHVIAKGPAEHADENAAWAEGLSAALAASGTGATFPSYSSASGPELLERTYGEEAWARLAAVKATYDPGDVFRADHHVAAPAGEGVAR